QIGFQGKNLTEEVLSAWAKTLSGKSKTVKEKLGVVRGFGKYLNTLGYDSFLPTLPKVKSNYIPYIFSDEEVALIFHYAEAMPLAHIVEHFLNAFGEGQQNFSPSFMHTIEKGSPLNSAKNSICKLLESLRFHTFIYFLHIKNTTKPLSSIVLIIYK
ncbi:MAG: hypothetical protein RR063_11365, partial [Anaerovoracaceae bacterium]